MGREISTRDGDGDPPKCPQFESSYRRLEACLVPFVSYQEVSHAQGEGIESPGRRHAELAESESAQILHGCQETGLDDLKDRQPFHR